MKGTVTAPCLIAFALLSTASTAGEGKPDRTIFVENGVPKLVREDGKPWKRGDGYIECSGYDNYLYAGRQIGAGDFHITAKLAILNLSRSAASFVIEGRSHFGFEGSSGKIFVEGPVFGKRTHAVGEVADFFKPDTPLLFEVVRKGTELSFLINGKPVYRTRYTGKKFGMFGFRPWRSTMQISDFSAQGQTVPLPRPRTRPTTYTIPIIDLSGESHRQVVVARGTAEVYQGHPTTVLMNDNKTIFCVWTVDHGGPCGPIKKSTDGGLTWSDFLPVPENWKTVRNCPCIHRLTDPGGVERLFVFAGNGDMYQSVSEDGGRTWSPMEKNGLHCVVAPITIVPIAGNRYLALYHQRNGDAPAIWQSISSDGGLTWEPERKIAEFEGAYPCEPAVIRSPDGKQLAALMRENTRRYNSLLIISDDEGETWSKPVELPASLTGDRHMPRYAHDGRLVIPFRDTAADSPTKGDFAAWVGTYDDIVNGREGQYRVRLLNSPKKGDLGYPGLELLPDGTFIATTYAVLREGEKNSVVSVRFTMEELDEKAKMLPEQTDIFEAGKDGYHTYRIPALVVSKHGTILAFCEGRKNSSSDTGDIDVLLKRSTDGGRTWGPQQIVWNDGPNTCGNPCPVLDRATGTIWLLLTWNLGEDSEKEIKEGTAKDSRRVFVTYSNDDGATWADPVEITEDVKRPSWRWYATGPGHGIQLKNGRLLIPCDHSEHEAPGHPYRSHVIYSDDHGATWKLGGALGEKTNECTAVETEDGSAYLNMRSYHGKNRRACAWSKDGGEMWSEVRLEGTLVEPVCQASVIRFTDSVNHDKNRVLFSNPASTKRQWMTVRTSQDECRTWNAGKVLYAGPSAYSDMCITPGMTICCLYERGKDHPYEKITCARFRLDWLTDGAEKLR